ncbi:MAG: hypothetical protein QOF37_15 [Thermoleophilaceae bacterium]|jgi:hypothetical protein|nr:hypothetical protein [Thermoleophilaceae bacterium]
MADERIPTKRQGNWDEDPVWAAARERTRDEVRAAFAGRTIVCSSCGHEAAPTGRTCPSCGEPYVATREPFISKAGRRRLGLALLGTAVVLGALAAVIVPQLQTNERGVAARDRAAHAAFVKRTRAELAIDQRLQTSTVPAHAPVSTVIPALEAAITRETRARVKAGSLRGPVIRTDCTPWVNNPRTGATLRFECTAVNALIPKTVQRAGVIGYPIWAKADTAHGRLYWCKLNPRPGEKAAGVGELSVPLDRRCDLNF